MRWLISKPWREPPRVVRQCMCLVAGRRVALTRVERVRNAPPGAASLLLLRSGGVARRLLEWPR